MRTSKDSRRFKLVTTLTETFGFSPLLASLVVLFLGLLVAAVILWVVLSAPPRTLTVTSGPAGSSFERHAEAYRQELAKHGVTLKIVPSDGSLANLQQLQTKDSGVDIGFVQDGVVGESSTKGLISLGSVAYQPLWVFYHGTTRVTKLSEFAGRRLGIGASGSGVHTLAAALLEANGVTGAATTLVETPGEVAGRDFLAGKIDVLFLMGDSAPIQTLRTLLRTPEVQIFTFTQADAYLRRFTYLNKIVMPQGAIDLGLNLPSQDIVLVGPTVELVARDGLNSAVSDLLLGVAQTVHGRPSMMAKRGEFPAPLEHDFPLSDDALRYYKSGKGLTYKLVTSFWLANLINRLLVAIVPFLLVLIPTIRFFPVAYRWSVQVRIYRCYRPLLRVERDAEAPLSPGRVEELLSRLDTIDEAIHSLKVPASFASQFYDLRNHAAFVRTRLKSVLAA